VRTAARLCAVCGNIEAHYDGKADIAWLRFERCDAATVVAQETEFGLRELDPNGTRSVGLE
jgi:hypothetical protein